MALHYDAYCRADRMFYESLDRLDDVATRFPATNRTVPGGWDRRERGVWITLQPRGIRLPQQGWKIHVSSLPDTAGEVVEVVWNFCVAERLPFKFLRSRDVVLAANAKYADRASSGKLVTIYPGNEAELERTLRALSVVLAQYQGPYILSDLRWKSGPLHVRFGGFVDRYCVSETGEQVLAVENPDGELVPDLRAPVFQAPAWVEVPDFIGAEMAAHGTSAPEPFPYRIEEALHFSNGGGIYLASDLRTERKVVLREARPFAGVDVDGSDAVERLHRERAALEKVSDLDFVPKVLGHFTFWEHHFLVEEYIEGETLKTCMARRYPLTRPDVDENALADYTTWALEVLDQIERAVETLHSRGLIFGDLHPGNVMIRPDGRVALIDFEGACNTADERRLGLGAAGFATRDIRTGPAVDRYALDCLRLALFLPLTTLLDKDPDKAAQLVAVMVRSFPVPTEFAARTLDRLVQASASARTSPLRSVDDAVNGAVAARPDWDIDEPDWAAVCASITGGILASATPQRNDRLFPGDINQFRRDGLSLAYGAAGVLYALPTRAVEDRHELVDWLIRRTRQASQIRPGLYDGLHGIAHVLDQLGHRDEALNVLDRALEQAGAMRTMGLFDGLAGIGLNLLHFAAHQPALRTEAVQLGDRLGLALDGRDAAPSAIPVPPQAGLMHGFTGPGVFFSHLFAATGDGAWLDLAARALRRDLVSCEISDDTLQMRDGSRLLPYLAHGSAGLGIGLATYAEHRHDEEFAIAQQRIRRACQAEFVIGSGLFTGRAGLIAYLSLLKEPTGATRAVLDMHQRRLAWHAVRHQGNIAFPGEYLLRLSMDVATGSAGVLLAMDAARGERSHPLPLLGEPPNHDNRDHTEGR